MPLERAGSPNKSSGRRGSPLSPKHTPPPACSRLLQTHRHIALEEFSEADPASTALLLAAEKSQALEVLVVVSHEPPSDPALRRRFHVINITRPG